MADQISPQIHGRSTAFICQGHNLFQDAAALSSVVISRRTAAMYFGKTSLLGSQSRMWQCSLEKLLGAGEGGDKPKWFRVHF